MSKRGGRHMAEGKVKRTDVLRVPSDLSMDGRTDRPRRSTYAQQQTHDAVVFVHDLNIGGMNQFDRKR